MKLNKNIKIYLINRYFYQIKLKINYYNQKTYKKKINKKNNI